jgi:phage gp16-like protein
MTRASSPRPQGAARARAPATRAHLIASVHAFAKAAGLDEDARRDVMERATGLRSAAAMDEGQLARAVAALKALAPARVFTPHGDPLVRKVHALWGELKRAGAVSAARPHGFAKRLTHLDRVEWASPEQLAKVIEALKQMQARPARPRGVDAKGRSR